MNSFKSILMLMLVVLNIINGSFASDKDPFDVLILNSYHEGYQWSDDLAEGIKSQFLKELNPPVITIEYMDTKNNYSEDYLSSLYQFLSDKYASRSYDVIIACDDAAFTFMQTQGRQVFGDTPYVFCGVNFYDASLYPNRDFTGIVETYDVLGTLNLALHLNSNVKNVYIINDKSTTGLLIENEIRQAEKAFPGVSFKYLNDQSFKDILTLSSSLQDDSIFFYGTYLRDVTGEVFDYKEPIRGLSEKSSVPIYGMWEFLLGHGLTGGNLTSGFDYGAQAGHYAIAILSGQRVKDLPVLEGQVSNFKFDHTHMLRYGLDVTLLPKDSVLINRSYDDRKNILVLHSYHKEMTWVASIEEGIQEVINTDQHNVYFDYMDTKRHPDSSYIKDIYDLMNVKHLNNQYDVIIVSDNNAFNFILQYGKTLFKDIPIVFCGLNNFEAYEDLLPKTITGVVENIDLEATLDIALIQNPLTKRVVVINDSTPTGLANKTIVDQVALKYPHLSFDYWSQVNMADLLQDVSALEKDTLVLLLSFNKDLSNNVFSYEQAGELIASASSAPVYVLWDFYLGTGVAGGYVTSGYTQGYKAAELAMQIIDGQSPSNLPVIKQSPNTFAFDLAVLLKHGIQLDTVPEGSTVLNAPINFIDAFGVYLTIIGIALLVIMLLTWNYKRRMAASQKQKVLFESYASIDQLTQVYSRRKGLDLTEEVLNDPRHQPVSLCFIDMDHLKTINDTHGHAAGDDYIKSAISYLKQKIRHEDILFRFGGDEFILVLPATSNEDAHHILSRATQDLQDINTTRSVPIEYSYGIVTYENDMDLIQFINAADEKMYQQKMQKKVKAFKTTN